MTDKTCGCLSQSSRDEQSMVLKVFPICNAAMTQEDFLCDSCRVSPDCIRWRDEQQELKKKGWQIVVISIKDHLGVQQAQVRSYLDISNPATG